MTWGVVYDNIKLMSYDEYNSGLEARIPMELYESLKEDSRKLHAEKSKYRDQLDRDFGQYKSQFDAEYQQLKYNAANVHRKEKELESGQEDLKRAQVALINARSHYEDGVGARATFAFAFCIFSFVLGAWIF